MDLGALIVTWLAAVALAQAPVDTLRAIPLPDRAVPMLEGRRKHLSAESARRIRVEACPEHLPQGSRAWDNLAKAVSTLNAARRVALHLELVPAERHLDPRRLFAVPRPTDPPTIRVDFSTENPKGGELKASGAAFQFHTASKAWRWGDDGQSLATHSGVVAFNPVRGFRRHMAAPRPGMPGYDPASAPSLGVLSHELGHLLGFGHDEKRKEPELVGLAVHRGSGRHVTDGVKADGTIRTGADQRQGKISAYTQWALERRYPVQTPVPDQKPEWHLHEVVAFPETPPWVTDPDGKMLQSWELSDLVPDRLRATAQGYVDCRTGKAPVLYIQYSDTSNVASDADLRVSVTLGHLGTVAERTHRAQYADAPYVQYTWTRTLHLDTATPTLDVTQEHTLPLRISVGDPSQDIDPTDNVFDKPITLLPADTRDRRCLDDRSGGPR